jgi:hypothetical protein
MALSIYLLVYLSIIHCAVSSQVLPIRRRDASSSPSRHVRPLTSAQFGTIFDVEVQFGNQSFLFLVDTGSSDTWVMQTGYKCVNATDNLELPQEACGYANKTYDISPTFKQIPDQNFGVQYGVGVCVGIVGYEDVTLAGLTVKGQEVGLVTSSTNPGDGLDSGLLGLAYPALTSAHPGTNTSNTSLIFDRVEYTPLLQNMHKQGLIDPYFSLAIQRTPFNISTGDGGYLALGGLPPVDHSPDFAVVPVEITEAVPLNVTSLKRQLSFWTLTVQGAVWSDDPGNRYFRSPFQAVVDSGNPASFFPRDLAESVNAAFSPPATPIPESPSVYAVDCNAKPPTFGLTIGNQTFYHAPEDLIINHGDGTCTSGLGNADAAAYEGVVLYFLGDVFLKNVVAVFDFGKDEMRFASTLNVTGDGNGTSTTSGAPSSSPTAVRSLAGGKEIAMQAVSAVGFILTMSFIYV